MNIHEYQAKSLLAKFGVPVPRGGVAYKFEEAENVARELGGPVWVVKSQIHAGGRGKGTFKEADAGEGGGVRLAKSVEEAAEEATQPRAPRGDRCPTSERVTVETVTMQAMASAMGPPSLDDLADFDFTDEALDDPLGIAQSWEEKHGRKAPGEDEGEAAAEAKTETETEEASP